jgi:hypothetical protein
MTANYNRIIELAESELLVVLPDDDMLYPDYLAKTLPVLEQQPATGVVHTAFDLIDQDGHVLERGRRVIGGRTALGVERGREFIERGMRSSGLACWTSCLFRRAAIAAAGGFRDEDEPFGDGPLMMRIAVDWDIAWIAHSCVAVRTHEKSTSAFYAPLIGGKYEVDDTLPEMLLRQRMRFLDEARFSAGRRAEYRSIARSTYRRDTVGRLARQIGVRRGRVGTLAEIVKLGRRDVRMLFVPGMLKMFVSLVAGHFVELGRLGQLHEGLSQLKLTTHFRSRPQR